MNLRQKQQEKLERYIALVRDEGVLARSQFHNFLAASYFPHAKQRKFHTACRECDAPDGPTSVGYGGARGPGKSHAILAQLALDDCQRMPELKCLSLRRIGRAARESFEDLRLRVLPNIEHEYRRSDGVVTFPNDSRIVLGHFHNESDVDRYLGLEYDVIAVEEATTLTSAKYKSVTTCNRTSKPDWRPRIYTGVNPGGVGHAWYKALYIVPARTGNETETRFIFGTVDDNPFINQDYVKRLDALTGWQKRAWRWGDWDIAAGQYFVNWRHDAHVIAPIPVESYWQFYLVMDYGWSHWNAVYLLALWDGVVYVIDENLTRQTVVPQVAEGVKAMLARHRVTQHIAFIAGQDTFSKTKGVDVAAQWKEEGFLLKPADMDRIQGAAEVARRLGDPNGGMPPTLCIFNTCTHLIETLPALQHDPHRPEDVLKWDCDEDGHGGDDGYDALRYGLMELRQPVKVEYGTLQIPR